MTLIPHIECCAMLGIDPRTLRTLLKHAQMQFTAHPTDGRRKCLTHEQVQQLARLHNLPLSLPVSTHPVRADESASSELHTPFQAGEQAVKQDQQAYSSSHSVREDVVLRMRLAALETKVRAMQEQLTQLAFQLLREREQSVEQRLSALETHIGQEGLPCPPSAAPKPPNHSSRPEGKARREQRLLPVEQRARSRVTPIIEYGAQGNYVAVCPEGGVLPFLPDSAEWFDWLASLSSFRFVGQQGCFTAYRRGRSSRSWRAHRVIDQQHKYKLALGVTDSLTIQRLEQVAAALPSDTATC